MSKITLILGGASCGKSLFAESLAARHTEKLYLATAESRDEEMKNRIRTHQARRGPDWQLREEPIDITSVLKTEDRDERAILIDCLSLWLTNLMMAELPLSQKVDGLIAALDHPKGHLIFVSNEVGLSIVPENQLARRFREEQGILNQKLAKRADNVVFIAAGIPINLKGATDGS